MCVCLCVCALCRSGATVILAVAAGYAHSCVLLNDNIGNGVVRCWGDDGTNGAYTYPGPGLADVQWTTVNPYSNALQLSGQVLTGAIAISAGYETTCAVLGAPDYAVVCKCFCVILFSLSSLFIKSLIDV